MKKLKSLLMCVVILQLVTADLSAQSVNLKVHNELNIDRPEAIVEIMLSDVIYWLPDGSLNKLGIVNKATGERLPSQLVDSNQDGENDLFIFQDSFTKMSANEYELKYFEILEKPVHKVYVTFIPGREDIAWENDKAAFRMYGPALAGDVDNGIDAWSKSVDYLIISKWYREEEEGKSYHTDHGEGADFFSVGKSLGCGGSAIYLADSLYQSGVYTTYKILENGPLRLMFQLEYVGFSAGGNKVTETKIVTLDAGSHLNKIETSYSTLPAGAKYTAGLVKRANTKTESSFEDGIISLWGDNTVNKADGLFGTAVVMKDYDDLSIIENGQHIMMTSKFMDGNKQVHYAGSCWSKAGDIKSENEWLDYLNNFLLKLRTPLWVEIVY